MTESGTFDIVGIAGSSPKVGRRLKRYPLSLKHRIVEETFVPGASVAGVARRHGVNDNLVFEWRKQYRLGILGKRKAALRGPARTTGAGQALLRIGVIGQDGNLYPTASEPSAPSPPLPMPACADAELAPAQAEGRIEIILPNGLKVRVDGEVGERALTVALVVAKGLVV